MTPFVTLDYISLLPEYVYILLNTRAVIRYCILPFTNNQQCVRTIKKQPISFGGSLLPVVKTK